MGLIRNSNQAKQGVDFEGVEWGKIHPTDIDFVLEFKNEVLILGEVKAQRLRHGFGAKTFIREAL